MKIIKINNKGRMPKGMITEYDPGYFITDANQSTVDDATNKGENMYIPNDTDEVEFEVVQVNVSQIVMAWRNDIRNRLNNNLPFKSSACLGCIKFLQWHVVVP